MAYYIFLRKGFIFVQCTETIRLIQLQKTTMGWLLIWSQILSSNSAFNLIVNFDYILNNLIWNGFKMASQLVFDTADVSRSTFCHDDTHKDWQSEYNTSVAVVAGNKYKCNKSVYEQLVCHWLPIHKTYLYRHSEHLTFNLICIKWLNFPALFVRKQC